MSHSDELALLSTAFVYGNFIHNYKTIHAFQLFSVGKKSVTQARREIMMKQKPEKTTAGREVKGERFSNKRYG